ncbi:ferritin-like domain-containing protein [uncultured Jatrophihabitans sp.]|uniref:YciE/YciF ferroxidase family protein n=1 Tax=uncultured Jatrophihabitans sp. TaxID=1610747 RepID=UPI0035C9EF8A
MFEHLTTPEEIFSFKLGSALSMEHDTLAMLADLEQHAQRAELKTMFREHAEETRQQIANIEQCFALLGESVDDSPSPVTKGLAKEGTSTIKKTDDSIVDAVILAGALETEHYEIAVYETLVTNAEARGATEVATLLRQNLTQEESARDKVKQAAQRISQEGIAVRTSVAG